MLSGGLTGGWLTVAGLESINLNTNGLLFKQESIKCHDMPVKPVG